LPVPSSASSELAAAIAAADSGAIPFDQYMSIALYGAHGFYTSGGSAGRRGDFITSPEVGPLFGAVMARAITGCWRDLGEPDDFRVVEVGAGPGTLARAILAARPRGMASYVAVEVSAAQRERHPAGVVSQGEMPTEPFVGMIVANELLDNLPFRLAVFDNGWREAFVTIGTDTMLAEVLSAPIHPLPSWLPSSAPHGSRVPLQDAAAAWVGSARDLLTAGSVLACDYATESTAQLAAMPWREWLRTYRGHERGSHYLRDPGLQDITTQVALDQLPHAEAVRTQRQFLLRWGIEDLVEEGRRRWTEHASAPNVAALTMRSRISEAEALLDAGGLGAFSVIEWASRGEGP
jgi:SAM-dependent MidA family methyltransferase